jgi:hypothetical protein
MLAALDAALVASACSSAAYNLISADVSKYKINEARGLL